MAFISQLPVVARRNGFSVCTSRPSVLLPDLLNHRYHTSRFPPHRANITSPICMSSSSASTTSSTSTASASVSVGVGTSALEITDEAMAAAVNEASGSLSDNLPSAAIVLTTVDRPVSDIQAALRKHLKDVPVHAATSCSAILTNGGPQPNAVSVLLLHAPQNVAVAAAKFSDSVSPSEATKAAAKQLSSSLNNDVSYILLFASPGSEESVLSTLSEVLPSARVFGGSAADNTVEGKWSIYDSETSFTEGVSMLGISSSVKFAAELVPPYRPSETSSEVTSASGRVIKTLDGKPAAEVICQWIGSSVDAQAETGGAIIVESATTPLGVDRGDGEYVGIHAAEITPDGSVGLFAEVSEGERLVKMNKMGGRNSALAAFLGIEKAYDEAMRKGDIQKPKAGILIYCGGLSIAVGDDLAKSLQGLKGKAPLLGMTAFGEQGYFEENNVHSNLAVGIGLFG